jgi:predicted nucleic acid-binding protein
MIFIDADAFIAIYIETDFHHLKAIKINESKPKDEVVTSSEVIFEVTTKLSYLATHKLATTFLSEILKSSVTIEYITPVRLQQTMSLFQKQSSKRVSLTDCANMIICKELGIKQIFSFDQHYTKNGFKLLK